VAELKNYLLTR